MAYHRRDSLDSHLKSTIANKNDKPPSRHGHLHPECRWNRVANGKVEGLPDIIYALRKKEVYCTEQRITRIGDNNGIFVDEKVCALIETLCGDFMIDYGYLIPF
jgi:hypothetical protein